MKVNGKAYRAVWMEKDVLYMIDQKALPFRFEIISTTAYQDSCERIKDMTVRGAGTIGATGGFAMAQAFLALSTPMLQDNMEAGRQYISQARNEIESARPTAVDLFYAVNKVYEAGLKVLEESGWKQAGESAFAVSQRIADQYVENSRSIGKFGSTLIKDNFNILTHCNAGWLALVDYGSALSPIYLAHEAGLNIHVWVDETRPRSQGARLTAWELQQQGIQHTIVADNAAGLLMSLGKVDMLITGADRIARNGDTANKIGTLGKAVLASEYNIPYYVAAPVSTFDKECACGNDILIEDRSKDEVIYMKGPDRHGDMHEIMTCNPGSPVYNPAFDITPARFISAYITEKGIFKDLSVLYEHR